MEHFICTGGCSGVSAEPGKCQAPTCKNFQVDLVNCSCGDGHHGNNESSAPAESSSNE